MEKLRHIQGHKLHHVELNLRNFVNNPTVSLTEHSRTNCLYNIKFNQEVKQVVLLMYVIGFWVDAPKTKEKAVYT